MGELFFRPLAVLSRVDKRGLWCKIIASTFFEHTMIDISENQLPNSCSIADLDHYVLLKQTQRKLGIGRIKLGALLYVIKSTDSWKGRGGQTFRQFLIEEGFDPKAIYQYMKVAKCFVIDYQLDGATLEKIALASMRSLCLAVDVASPERMERIIEILASLPRPEANEELRNLLPQLGSKKPASPVSKILDQVSELTLDDKAALFSKIGLNRNQLVISGKHVRLRESSIDTVMCT